MSTPNHRRHFGALGATASCIKVSSGGRELLSGIDSGTTLSLGGSCRRVVDLHKPSQLGGIGIRPRPGVIGET
jgi:hypothetical protein